MNVVHDPQTRRFTGDVGGHACRLDYRLHEHDREVMFTHAFVPPALRGHGAAAELVKAALDWARAEGLKVVPACSYVRVYMRRHPETLGLLADEHP
jgi:predicted GNAT family acetyltransferase